MNTPLPRPLAEARLESQLEHQLFDSVRRMGGIAVKLAPTVKGLPDRLVLMPGARMYLVELKTVAGRLSPAQELWHQTILERTGITVHVAYGRAGVSDFIRMAVGQDDPKTRRPRQPRQNKTKEE